MNDDAAMELFNITATQVHKFDQALKGYIDSYASS